MSDLFLPGPIAKSWLVQVSPGGDVAVYRLDRDGKPVAFRAGNMERFTSPDVLDELCRDVASAAGGAHYGGRWIYGGGISNPWTWRFEDGTWADVADTLNSKRASDRRGHARSVFRFARDELERREILLGWYYRGQRVTVGPTGEKYDQECGSP